MPERRLPPHPPGTPAGASIPATLTRGTVAAAVRALDLEAIAARRWYAAKGETPVSARLLHAFALGSDAALAVVELASGERGERRDRYAIAFAVRDGVLHEAREGDGAWRALASAMTRGQPIPALTDAGIAERGTAVAAVLVCRPTPAFAELWPDGPEALALAPEAALGRDQSNTSVVLGDRLLLKAYRRIQPGLNPDLELTALLSEESHFPGVPRLAGWAELVDVAEREPATVAMLQAFVAHADDAYESTAERLAALVGGAGPADLEAATGIAEDLGLLVAGLHAALASPPSDAPDLAPREATHDELRAWRMDAHRQLNAAIAAVGTVDPETAAELRRDASAVAARVSRFEAVATVPILTRIHADLHLGQVLAAEDGYRIIDFEGEPLRPIEERRRPDSPLRDVASMLRSLDHVARSARRRAERANGGQIARPGLDVDAWIDRARERFLGAYAAGLRGAGAPIVLDLDLLDAFEVAKETYEFVYAATVLPSWLWAPREGMRWLLAHGEA